MENEVKPEAHIDNDNGRNGNDIETSVESNIDAPAIQDSEGVQIELSSQQKSQLDEQSSTYVGEWNRLNSTTNWSKGKIILEWRENLDESDLPESSYTDESWCQMVGGVTPQHVGRLRRTFNRFGHVHSQYEGLFWSHFYAALEWDDSEMWLEGAVQNQWSVSAMRRERWETLGKDPSEKPQVTDIVVTEADEEVQALASAGRTLSADGEVIEGPIHDGPDFGDEPTGSGSKSKEDGSSNSEDGLESVQSEATGPKIRPFESFTELPKDISEALNSFKVAIITHKAKDWDDIPRDDVLGVLDALKQLVTAASE